MTHTIICDSLTKTYKVEKKRPGLTGSLRDLIKPQYKSVMAAKNISFVIDEGELVGFIGPNGAGKTTTLKMLSGLLYPTSGSVQVLGHDPWLREYPFLTQISLVMGQKNQLWWDLPANLYKKNLSELTEMLDLSKVLNTQVRKLSLGQRMKAELAVALLHSPKVLFLDEPTIGLDVVMQQVVRNFIKEYNDTHEGAIILTSHYMEDVKELCKRVIIINEGEILYDGLLADVITKFSNEKIIEVILRSGKVVTHKVSRDEVTGRSAKLLQNLDIVDINIKEIPIEEVIRQVFASANKNKK